MNEIHVGKRRLNSGNSTASEEGRCESGQDKCWIAGVDVKKQGLGVM